MNPAEALIDEAKRILLPAKLPVMATQLGQRPLAIEFYRAPEALKFRALVEDWSVERIIQELH